VVAAVIAFLALPAGMAMTAIIVTAAAATGFAIVAQRQIGGQTGDVLGAAEQVCEVAVLLTLAARFAQP
jgi:adenosylcobinamide-GDP ribazoletransferase